MGYFDEDLDESVDFPVIGIRRERQLGAFLVAWNALESVLDTSFPVLFRIDPTLAPCIYANLGTQTKIDILSSAVDALSDAIGMRQVDSAHTILLRIRTLNERARNTLAHGQRTTIHDKRDRPFWALVRYVARKRQAMVLHPSDVRHWRRMTNAVKSAARAWNRKMRTIHNILKKFSDDEMWELSQIHWREAKPIFLRLHKPRIPTKADSLGHPPSPGKQKRKP
jgi:hypothetical protein